MFCSSKLLSLAILGCWGLPLAFAQAPRFALGQSIVVLTDHVSVAAPLTNSGTADASDLQITSIKLDKSAPSGTPNLPRVIGTLRTGQSVPITALFEANNLAPGARVLLSIQGAYRAGAGMLGFAVNQFITIPVRGNMVTIGANRTDPLLFAATTPQGETFQYFGQKDGDGLGAGASSVVEKSAAGETRFFFDADGTRAQLQTADGPVFRFSVPQGGGPPQVTAVTAPAGIELTTVSSPSAVASVRAAAVFPEGTPNGHPAPAAATVTPSASMRLLITKCGRGVTNARVTVTVKTPLLPQSAPRTFIASPTGPAGAYQVSLPVPDPDAGENLQEKCMAAVGDAIGKLQGPVAQTCELVPAETLEQNSLLLCSTFAVSAFAAELSAEYPAFTPEKLFSACEGAIKGYAAVCKVAQFPEGPPGFEGPGIGDAICNGVQIATDLSYSLNVLLDISVNVDGVDADHFTATPSTLPKDRGITLACSPGTLAVIKSGSRPEKGRVFSVDGKIDCGTACQASFVNPATVSLIAETSDPSVVLSRWIGACFGNGNSASVDVSAEPKVCYAVFDDVARIGLTIAKTGTGGGIVSTSPAGISCGTDCSNQTGLFPKGSSVTVTATPTAGERITWRGCASSTAPSITLKLDSDTQCEIEFVNTALPSLTLLVEPSGDQQVRPGDSAYFRATVTDQRANPVNAAIVSIAGDVCGPGSVITDQSGTAAYTCLVRSSTLPGFHTVEAGPAAASGYNSSSIVARRIVIVDSGGCAFTLDRTSGLTPSNAATGTFGISAPGGCSWVAQSSVPWISIVSGATGSGNGTVQYAVLPNPDSTPRTGTLIAAGQTFSVVQAGVLCTFSLGANSASVPANGSQGSVTVTAPGGCAWAARSGTTWLALSSGTSGQGSGTATFSAGINADASPRAGTLTIAGQPFTVTQAGGSCSYSINPTSASFTAGGGGGSTSVTAGAGCNWTADSGASWISITSGKSGGGNGTVVYTVAPNPGPGARGAVLAVAGQSLNVNQAAPACPSTISPTSASLSSSGGTGNVAVTASSSCNWFATSNSAWLTIVSGFGGAGNGSVSFQAAVNPDGTARTGTIGIGEQNFVVNQQAAPCTFSINPASASAPSGGSTGSVGVIAPTGCSWSASSNVSWISITSSLSGNGNGSVEFTILANSAIPGRSGTITVAGKTFTVDQSGTGCVFSINPTSASVSGGATGGSITVNTQSGCSWLAVSNDAWIAVTSGSGTGSGTAIFNIAPNSSTSPRTGTITIGGNAVFTVYQSGAGCTFSINPQSAFVSSGGTGGSIAVTAKSGCTWVAVSNDPWITVTSGATGNGNGTILFNVAPNSSTFPRDGTITAAGNIFSVHQDGVSCNFSINPSAAFVTHGGGGGTVTVNANPGCTWVAVSNASWISIVAGTTGSGSGTVQFSYGPNSDPHSRTGTMTIAGQTFTLEQDGNE